MKPTFSFTLPHRRAFTLVELLVSTALIGLLMVLLLSTVDQTQRVWSRTTSKVAQFQSSRIAFDSMTSRLSQATLNAYWKAFDTNTANTTAELLFRRQSELQFLSGNLSDYNSQGNGNIPGIFTSNPGVSNLTEPTQNAYPTQGMFFFAPLGATERVDTSKPTSKNIAQFRDLDSMLTACGYFIEYGDEPARPAFLPNPPVRNRFRLVELTIPAESISVYRRPLDASKTNPDHLGLPWKYSIQPEILNQAKSHYFGRIDSSLRSNSTWIRPLWMEEALLREPNDNNAKGYHFKYGRTIAENVIALAVLPKLAERDRRSNPLSVTSALDPTRLDGLAPEYQFDSWRILKQDQNTQNGAANAERDNLLPPIVQIVMVAIDEPSALRLGSTSIPDWTTRERQLFTAVQKESDLLEDLEELEKRLQDDRINYRVFSTDVVIRGSKWSKDPKK